MDHLVTQLQETGPTQFAAWDAEAFASYASGPAAALQRAIAHNDKSKPDTNSLENYLRLVYEGVGAGWLPTISYDVPPPTFLAHCLATLVPYQLAMLHHKKRGETLANIWNLGEGLARQPMWLNQYVISQTTWNTKIDQMTKHLEDVLTPVLTPPPPSSWSQKPRLSVHDLHEHRWDFVPGRLYLAAPAVLCVADRVDPSHTIAFFLRHSGKSTVIGNVPPLPEYAEEFDRPRINTGLHSISINEHEIDAPFIGGAAEILAVSSGFVAVTAEDSQNLWLAEAI